MCTCILMAIFFLLHKSMFLGFVVVLGLNLALNNFSVISKCNNEQC